MSEKTPAKVEITHRSILFIFLVLGIIWFIVSIWEIVLVLFISTLLATALYPIVDFFERFKMPRALSTALTLFVTLIASIGLIVSIFPVVLSQINTLIVRLPTMLAVLSGQYPWLELETTSITPQIAALPSRLFKIAADTLTALIFVVTSLFISFYIIVDRNKLDDKLGKLFGDQKDEISLVISAIETKLGNWVRGQLIVMLLVGLLTYVGLKLVGIEYALPLAIIAGLFELVPNLGPTAAAIPAIIVGLAMSPAHGAITLILYIAIQQVETLIITPQVMRKVVNLHPIVTIVALLVGFRLGGVLMAILSLPIVLTAQIILGEIYKRKESFLTDKL